MLNFTQKEIELEIAAVLESGDITDISNITKIGYSYVNQQLNPNDERKSYIVGALEIVCALDEISPIRGEKLWQKIQNFREASKNSGCDEFCLDAGAAAVATESTDVASARLTGKTLLEQLAECVEAESAIVRQKEAIIAEINKQKEMPNNSGILRAVK